MSNLKKSVEVVGEPWKESPYYSHAERWIHVFWGPQTIFRNYFERLDLDSVVDLACGHGRHAAQIADSCGELVLIDIHEENLDVCRKRLASHQNIRYIRNNGYDFHPLEDGSVSAIYCYDAMVHFSPDIVGSYLVDAKRVLKPGGQALFHHSNYPAPMDQHYGLNPHARNHMTEALFTQLAAAAGLTIVESVAIDWGNAPNLDRVSLLRKDTESEMLA